jgi:hypothetical protein
MFGKGVRHGGASVPWLEQPIFHYAEMHGRGFLTGQAAKKLEEAASTRSHEAFVTEVLGAIVYCGAALIKEQQDAAKEGKDRITFERKWPWQGEEPEARIILKRQPEPLCEGSISAEKERATRSDPTLVQRQLRQGHDGPGGVIRASDPCEVLRASDPATVIRASDSGPWGAYQESRNDNIGRFGAGRFDLPPAPAQANDAQVFNTLRTCTDCAHVHLEKDQSPCAECEPRHGHPYWEARLG